MVFTGVSGSGKSSLAFGTLYAEAQRRYFESVAPYARRLIDQVAFRRSMASMVCPLQWLCSSIVAHHGAVIGWQRHHSFEPGAHALLACWSVPRAPTHAVCGGFFTQHPAGRLPALPWTGPSLRRDRGVHGAG